jgi:RimJ/RimL family protein N-acetyltransferase
METTLNSPENDSLAESNFSPIFRTASSPETFLFRKASVADIFGIMELYQETYQGAYTDPLMNVHSILKTFLENPNHYWFVSEAKGQLVASVVLRYDPVNLLAKAFGAVVKPGFRGSNMMERLLGFGMNHVHVTTNGIDVIYATTRTVHESAQALTERLGFKKLGIFPNSRKTSEYETHCLAAYFYPGALQKRLPKFLVHHRLKGLTSLVVQELPELGEFEYLEPEAPSRTFTSPPVLELVESEHFVRYRYEKLREHKELQFTFFPFHSPNVLVLSPDQSIEVFCHLSPLDEHAVIIGGKTPDDVNFTELFNSIASLLRENGARYVELLIRADKPKMIDSILKAKFIPSAFFPAFQLRNGFRYDYLVVSKTFEVFDFQNIKLKGLNQEYLEEYFKSWEHTALNPNLIRTSTRL